MEVNRDTVEKIIARATQEVLQAANPAGQPGKKALAVVPGFVFDQKGVCGYLKRINALALLFEEADLTDASIPQMRAETPEDRRKIAASLPDYSEVILVTPPLSLIRSIAQGDDTAFAAQVILRPLLWGVNVTLLTDFDSPGYRRGELLTELTEALASLEKAGMRIETLPLRGRVEEPKDFVSEQDVRDAAKAGKNRVHIKQGAIITQLARDTAKELGITIE